MRRGRDRSAVMLKEHSTDLDKHSFYWISFERLLNSDRMFNNSQHQHFHFFVPLNVKRLYFYSCTRMTETLYSVCSLRISKWSWIDTELNKKQDDCDDAQLWTTFICSSIFVSTSYCMFNMCAKQASCQCLHHWGLKGAARWILLPLDGVWLAVPLSVLC